MQMHISNKLAQKADISKELSHVAATQYVL